MGYANVKTIAVISVSRADFSILKPVIDQINRTSGLKCILIVGGSHLSMESGLTIKDISSQGYPITSVADYLLANDSPEAIAKSIGVGVQSYAQIYTALKPDFLLVTGDRFDMLPAALAAIPFSLPVGHLHGGEITEGAMDERIRHAITKLSHLHFVSTQDSHRRVIQMGEEPWRVILTGAPALDNLTSMEYYSQPEINRLLGSQLSQPFILATFHPTTLELDRVETQVQEYLAALDQTALPGVFSYSNTDPAGRLINKAIDRYVIQHPGSIVIPNLGARLYYSLMNQAAILVGNSSSGILEAASFKLPVVNVGNRQRGRLRPANVIDTPNDRKEILTAIESALSPDFIQSLEGMINPYGDGTAAVKLVQAMKQSFRQKNLLIKKFVDLPIKAVVATQLVSHHAKRLSIK